MAKRSAPATSTGSTAAPRKRTTTTPKKKANGAPAPSEEDIRLRAYHRYLERGGGQGTDFDDWLEAEKDLKATRHN